MEAPGAAVRLLAGLVSGCVAGALAVAVLTLPEPAPTLAPQVAAHMPSTGVGNPITAVLLAYPCDGHDARGDRAAARADRRLVARARPRLGRPSRAALQRRSRRHPRLHRARAAADRHHRRRLHLLGRRRSSGRQVPGRHDRRGDVAARPHGRSHRRAADQPAMAARSSSSRARSCSSPSASRAH